MPTSSGGRPISTYNGTPAGDDTPAAATTRPLRIAMDLDAESERAWSASVDVTATELPDFTRQARWTPTALGALAILAMAVLIASVIMVARDSSAPSRASGPGVAPATTVQAAPVAPSASAPPPTAEPPLPAPQFSAVTATASTLAAPPPLPPAQRVPEPKLTVRQRLHDLFPRLFPGR